MAHPFTENVALMAEQMMVAANQEEIAKLKRTLNLNPGQVEAIEAFFASEAEEQNKIMHEMFARKPLEELQAEMMGEMPDKEYFVLEDLLKDILTPDQMTTYEANEEKEALEEKEAMAYSQLSQMQRQLLLDEDQKDAVLPSSTKQSMMSIQMNGNRSASAMMAPNFVNRYQKIQNERLLEALSGVLTEDLLEQQREKLNSEMEMQRKSMQLFGGGFFSNATEATEE